jgi:hypothetical protein
MQNGKLPDEPRYIAGLLGCSVRVWNSVRERLIALGKIASSGGYLSNYRADKELVSSHLYQDKQRENAAKPRKNKGLALAVAKPNPSQSEPEPEEVREIGKPISRANDGFEDFWAVVPRKIAKPSAQKAYAKALRQTDAATLRSAMARYAETRRGQDPQFTAHPATWLNAGRWADEIETPKLTAITGANHGKATAGTERLSAFIAGAGGA